MRKKDIHKLPIRSFGNDFNENLESKFQIEALKPDKEGEGMKVEPHRHDYYHILYVKQGSGKHSIDFKWYEIKPNSIFFVFPGQVHSLEIDEHVEGYVISFSAFFYLLNNSIQKLLDYPFFHSINNSPIIYLSENDTKIHATINEIQEEYKFLKQGRDKIVRALFEVFLIRAARIYNQPIINQAPTHLTFQLRKFEALIEAHFKKYKRLSNYAEMMHVSPKHLNSMCKKGLNKTVTNLIHERILIEAKRLLLFTDNSIAEISFELGFSDKSYFMRFFKKQTSLTANLYRTQNDDTK
ncbi:MAG: AraC family transcriptional activator of pobA [Aureispira sp.]|jgi:AraC family transcriptional activator of pobA